MRIQPIESPRGIRLKLAYAHSRRTFGRVITPMKVVMARVPGALGIYHQIARFMQQEAKIAPSLKLLIQGFTAGHNQCGFCIDITRSFAAHDPALLEKLWRVNDYAHDPLFTDAERAALAYVEAVIRDRHVPDAVFHHLKKFYGDDEIVEITLVNAIEHFYNLVNGPLGIESDGFCAIAPKGVDDQPLERAAG